MAKKLVLHGEGFDSVIDEDFEIVMRPTSDANGDKFYGCDVCWTCSWFDRISKCEYVFPREIKISPAWFRCRIYFSNEYVEKLAVNIGWK